MRNNNFWQSKNVRLRTIQDTDWQRFHEEEADTEGIRGGEPGIQIPRSPEATQKWVEWAKKQTGADGLTILAIENMAGEFAGTCNLHNQNDRHGHTSFAIRIFRDFRRQGYAADAIQILLRYAFDELRYQKVNSETAAFNTSSIKLHENLGFTIEGRRRQMVYSDGRFHDEILFGMTKEEFTNAFPQDSI
ncbi:MAG: GNAT family N-acetyltransferase [Chloroflexi bacterium]|nr:GNAT family N-acetyltransferase [Chloroflexota bacterium]